MLNVSEKESAVSQENEDLKKSVKSLQEDLEELRSRSKSSEHDYEKVLSVLILYLPKLSFDLYLEAFRK